jgi:hypothetical protein
MKTRKQLIAFALVAIIVLAITACPPEPKPEPEHVHQWGAWVQTKAPTCTEAGVETRTCNLDATHTETRAGAAALGHNWEWVVTIPATYTADGVETKTCKHDPSHTDGTRTIQQLIYTTSSIADLETWLTSQPTNTVATAFKIALNVNDLGGSATTSGSVGKALKDNDNYTKYVSLDLSDSTITSIGQNAFYYCPSLTSISIPDSVTSIEDSAFYYCTSLTSVNIPAGVTAISDLTFYECRSLTSIVIPTSVRSIGTYAFATCINLSNINIPTSVETIGNYAFNNCMGISSITIPASVISLGNQAFGWWGGTGPLPVINILGYANQAAADTAWGEDWRLNCNATINYLGQ